MWCQVRLFVIYVGDFGGGEWFVFDYGIKEVGQLCFEVGNGFVFVQDYLVGCWLSGVSVWYVQILCFGCVVVFMELMVVGVDSCLIVFVGNCVLFVVVLSVRYVG